MKPKIVTIGAYGFTEESFFEALRETGVDTFCDLRARRGVRGSQYAFANSARLQARLEQMGIRYVHAKELAPPEWLRELQNAADRKSRTAKRARLQLSDAFVLAYTTACLQGFDAAGFVASLGPDAKVICLFCVEGAPEACHRSLVAGKLATDLGLKVINIRA